MKTTGNIFRTLLLAVLTLTFGSCSEDNLLSELGLDGQTTTRTDGVGEVWNGNADTSWYQADATEFQIATAEQLAGLAQLVNAGITFEGKTIKLTADILLNDTKDWENWDENTEELNAWTPIGNSNANPFNGTLDGGGHSVSGIYIINTEVGFQGLVGSLGEEGTLQNLGVEASYIKGYYYVGGVCGDNSGTVINCYNTGTVTGSGYVGGVCGLNYRTVTNCYNTGNVKGNNQVGGVCGENYATVTNCYYLTGTATGGIGEDYNNGEATAKTADEFQSGEVAFLLQDGQAEQVWGQLIGTDLYPVLGEPKVYNNNGTYSNMVMEGDYYLISTADELRLFASMVNNGNPGISGKLTADIELNDIDGWENWGNTPPANSWTPIGNYFTGTFDGQGHTISGLYIIGSDYSIYYAGLFGSLEGGTVENVGVTKSYIQGSGYTGGIVGFMHSGTIRNCYCTGIVRCQRYGGGIAGMSYGYDITIENCYFAGRISSESVYSDVIGPIVDGMHAEYVNPTNCYYLEGCGASGKGNSKTADEFKSGDVAWLLQGEQEGQVWGQTIGTDNYPVLTSDANKQVYAYTMYQGQSTEIGYANNNGNIDLDLTNHPNTIAVFEASGTFSGTNIVVKDGDNSYTCANLVLTDNAGFYTPVAFTATKATYTRSPKVWAQDDGSGSGWETLCLPFSGTLYAGGDAKQPVDVASKNGAYWLRSLTGFETPNTLVFSSPAAAADNQIKAGVPYIIALPGETFVGESLQGQAISVRGTNVTVTKEAQSVQPEGSLFAFTGTFATKACDAASYRLNSENGTGGAGGLFVLDTKELAPFRCRIDVIGLNIGGTSRSASSLPKELRIGQ